MRMKTPEDLSFGIALQLYRLQHPKTLSKKEIKEYLTKEWALNNLLAYIRKNSNGLDASMVLERYLREIGRMIDFSSDKMKDYFIEAYNQADIAYDSLYFLDELE